MLQSTGIPDSEFRRTCDALTNLNYKFVDFGNIPFTNIITNLENIQEGSLIARSGTKFVNLMSNDSTLFDVNDNEIEKSKFINSIDYDRNTFDQFYYNKLNLPLLNDDIKTFKYSEVKNIELTKSMFFKPTSDLKAFSATIVWGGETLESVIKSGTYQEFDEDNETILMTSLKEPEFEWRFFIVNNEVITGSQYFKDGSLNTAPFESIPLDVLGKAEEYAKLYTPADIFVMDLCLIKDEIKIVEYNCWNASGFYDSNLEKLFEAVQEFKSNRRAK